MDEEISHRDLPRALALLSEMNVGIQHVATLVDNMISRVHSGEITTTQGLSFLEMKYNMLLSYLINLTHVVLQKSLGKKIDGDPCIDNLVEIRTVLEKIKPIDNKLKYQINKLVKNSITGVQINDPALFKANPDNLIGKESKECDDDDNEEKKHELYVPPKLSAVHFTDESVQESNKRQHHKSKKLALSSSIMQDLREEYLDMPIEVSQGNRAQQILTNRQRERQEYEEEYLTRLPVTKAEKHIRKQLTTIGTLGDEITSFKNATLHSSRKRKPKNKNKNYKKKRFH